MERKKFETTLNDKTFIVEFLPLATQANGSVLVSLGETVVLANAVMGEIDRENIDYFPLTVDYEEKFYAAGRILGSRFVRREARPSEEAILISRLIDRALRPLFDHRMRREVQVTVLALSVDEKNDPDIPALLGASLALLTSDIPWGGPVSAARMAYRDKTHFVNPAYEERKESAYDMVIAGAHNLINMMEGEANEAKEEMMEEMLGEAQAAINQLNAFQEEIAKKEGKEKQRIHFEEISDSLRTLFDRRARSRLADALFLPSKIDRQKEIGELKKEWMALAAEMESSPRIADRLFEDAINEIVHVALVDEGRRPDGRKPDEVRPLMAEIGFLPRLHGSGLFFRGDTHILSVVTLGAPGDELLIEGMEVRMKKHFIHHYNFPPFSVGETGRMGSPGRREIGHGALAERALRSVIPDREAFPYTIRVVSETLSSNGSSSMGSACASSLALMDAGVPIKKPAAGIAMGLMLEQNPKSQIPNPKYKVLTDIQGPEDHHGDMDFKVAGTRNGVTAVQMDVKVNGFTAPLLFQVFTQARKARLEILDVMVKTIAKPRSELSPNAPRVLTITIPVDKIREVVGPGGKVINEIIAQTGADIDIEQTGRIFITAPTKEAAEKALARVEEITHEYQVGETFEHGRVTRIFGFGAMVEFAPGQEGLVHISELAPFRVNVVEDVVEIGDVVPVKIVGIDDQGRINLSIKDMATLELKPAGKRSAHPTGGVRTGDRRSGGGRPTGPASRGFRGGQRGRR